MTRGWLIFEYAQAAPFSLRLSVATTSAATTALVPSPACVKLALVDAAFQLLRSEAQARRIFDLVKGREVRVRAPRCVVVHKTFGRVLVPWEAPKEKGADKAAAIERDLAAHNYPFKRTISFTELAYWSEPIHIALDVTDVDPSGIADLTRLAWCVRYFGKRGSLVQLRATHEGGDGAVTCAGAGFARRADLMKGDDDWPTEFVQRPADDLSPEADFDRISVASPEKVRPGSVADLGFPERVDRFIALPFLIPLRLVRAGRTFAHYTRAIPPAPSRSG